MKFTLISDHEQNGPKITYEFEEDFLEEVVLNIEQFLKGSGYVFDSLEVNNELSESTNTSDYFDDEEDDILETSSQEDNMSATWPFPLGRPQEGTTEGASER
jgi:hypothetical protein